MRIIKCFAVEEENLKPPYWEMGQRIIKARETLTDMNQSDMTTALGLQDPTYGNYERGSRKMPPDIMKKFSTLTGCLADYIYLGKGDMIKQDELKYPPDIQDLVNIKATASKETWDAFFADSTTVFEEN